MSGDNPHPVCTDSRVWQIEARPVGEIEPLDRNCKVDPGRQPACLYRGEVQVGGAVGAETGGWFAARCELIGLRLLERRHV